MLRSGEYYDDLFSISPFILFCFILTYFYFIII